MSRQAMDEHKEHLGRLAVHDDALVSPLLGAGRGLRQSPCPGGRSEIEVVT